MSSEPSELNPKGEVSQARVLMNAELKASPDKFLIFGKNKKKGAEA